MYLNHGKIIRKITFSTVLNYDVSISIPLFKALLPWWRKWQPTPVFLPGKSQGQRSLADYSPWGRRVRHNWATKQQTWVLISFLFTFMCFRIFLNKNFKRGKKKTTLVLCLPCRVGRKWPESRASLLGDTRVLSALWFLVSSSIKGTQ